MTAYRTCLHCAVDRSVCTRLAGVRDAIAGASITSIKFRCADRKAMFAPGDRVETTWVVGSEYEQDAMEETWPGTVIQESGSRFVVKVDDAESDNGTPAKGHFKNDSLYVKVTVRRMKRLDEAPREVCERCGLVDDLSGCWNTGYYRERDCLRRRDEGPSS